MTPVSPELVIEMIMRATGCTHAEAKELVKRSLVRALGSTPKEKS